MDIIKQKESLTSTELKLYKYFKIGSVNENDLNAAIKKAKEIYKCLGANSMMIFNCARIV